MSIPPHNTTTRSLQEPVEDCRDFLRTGRCKYGASCKYYHPPNVQSGGGMKTPLDPSEPMFPIRPNEPVCQYYMKHGTCKFAQACKFHHPPQATQQAILNGGAVVLMNVARQHESTHLYLNPLNAEAISSSMMLQFLPQRPDEPDCIYFLKNGRCKYGATCRYHHPLNYHQRRAEEQRRHHEQRRAHMPQPERYQQIHYVTQPISGYPQSHVYLSDNPVTLVNVDRESIHSYQPFSIVAGADGTPSYCVPLGSTVRTEQASSTSSIASSYDTAVSNLEHLNTQVEPANATWNRRTGSVNSLNINGEGRRVILPHSASDGNIARRQRASSHGSASDHSLYYDTGGATMRRNGSSGSWRVVDRGSPLNQSHAMPSSPYGPRAIDPNDPKVGEMWASQARARPPLTSRRGPRQREDYEGFTMMTSALLNMLDTTEEVPAENYSDEDIHQQPASYANRMAHDVDSALFERLSLNSAAREGGYVPNADGDDSSWSPSWQGASGRRDYGDSNAVMQMIHPRQQRDSNSTSPHDPDVGLYLP